jgi:ABC-type nitrate/sulfonate/bicarbonate transport system ATPase subunit
LEEHPSEENEKSRRRTTMLPTHKMGEVVLLLERALQLSSKHEERQQRTPPD